MSVLNTRNRLVLSAFECLGSRTRAQQLQLGILLFLYPINVECFLTCARAVDNFCIVRRRYRYSVYANPRYSIHMCLRCGHSLQSLLSFQPFRKWLDNCWLEKWASLWKVAFFFPHPGSSSSRALAARPPNFAEPPPDWLVWIGRN